MLLRSMQNTRRIADAKAENDALRDDVAAGRRLHIKAVCQSVREATTASGVANAASPTGRHRWTDYFTLREIRSLCKTTGRNPEGINEQMSVLYRWAPYAIIVSNTALPASI